MKENYQADASSSRGPAAPVRFLRAASSIVSLPAQRALSSLPNLPLGDSRIFRDGNFPESALAVAKM